MSDSTGNIRRGALEAGQKTAQIVFVVCMVGLVGAVLLAQPGTGDSAQDGTRVSVSFVSTKTPRDSFNQDGAVIATLHSNATETPAPEPVTILTATASPTATEKPVAASRTPRPSASPAMIERCRPEIASRCAVPVAEKSSRTAWGMSPRQPSTTP